MGEEKFGLSSEESKQVSEAYLKNLGTKWLWFYTYIRMPLSVLTLLSSFPGGLSTLAGLIYLGFVVLLICNFVGLSGRKAWGYKLNWCVLTIECLLFPFTLLDITADFAPVAYLAYAGIFAFVWFLPNSIYFRKRKRLFIQEEH